jgi:hypothetical protein
MSWKAKTMVDALSTLADVRSANPLAQCQCGRRTNADMMLDLRPLPPSIRKEVVAVGHVADFACDACSERWFRTGVVSRVEVFTSLGAPPEVMAKIADTVRK